MKTMSTRARENSINFAVSMLQNSLKSRFQLITKLSAGQSSRRIVMVKYAHTPTRVSSFSSMTVVDLRSDTVTKPTPQMREAMRTAEVGDDVFGEDPTVKRLQEKVAGMFGKEASLFVPSCTMANTISTLVHCDRRFNEIILGNRSHMFLSELGVSGSFAGVATNGIPNQPDGTLKLEDIERSIRPLDDVHTPWTRVICLENTHNKCGGKILRLDYLQAVNDIARKHNLKLHLDGARVFNAAIALGVPLTDLTEPFDTVAADFSKGLCAPVGGVISGTRDFIQMATRARKALGGGMRQVGVLAAPILETLDHHILRLREDHDRAKKIAEAISGMTGNPVCDIDVDGVHSNILMIEMQGGVSPATFSARMGEVPANERKSVGESISVLMRPASATTVRCVLHHDVGDECVEKAIKKFCYVIKEFSHATNIHRC